MHNIDSICTARNSRHFYKVYIFIKISTDALSYKYILSNKKFEKEMFLIFDVTRIFNAKRRNASSHVKYLFISFYKNPNGYSNKNTLRYERDTGHQITDYKSDIYTIRIYMYKK